MYPYTHEDTVSYYSWKHIICYGQNVAGDKYEIASFWLYVFEDESSEEIRQTVQRLVPETQSIFIEPVEQPLTWYITVTIEAPGNSRYKKILPTEKIRGSRKDAETWIANQCKQQKVIEAVICDMPSTFAYVEAGETTNALYEIVDLAAIQAS